MTSAAPDQDEAPHGVSLARYAAVIAAIAEPFPRGRVLAIEEIDPSAFRDAEIVWKKRIARGAPRGPTFARFTVDLAAAEDWLIRRVTPLYQDPGAWGAFLAAFALKPREVLGAAGLGPNDFSRLSRHWTKLTAEDRGLRGDVADGLAKGPGALPRITAEPRTLRRSRVFEPVRAPAAAPAIAPVAARAAPPAPAIAHEPVAAPPSAPPRAHEPVPPAPPPSRAHAPGGTQSMPAYRPGPALPFAPKARPRTHAMPAVDERSRRPVLPFVNKESPPATGGSPAPSLRLEQYASLSVEIAESPERAVEIARRYGLTAAARAALDADYAARFARDPALHQAFLEAADLYRAWLAQSSRRR